ncbi:hypothetical protein SPRG_05933 [Saprolegnia parasitica CBS 223.65]|uniref:Methylmalonic aciduria and homocystinuria type D protein n=1 Tax=Saprolegnia parasitica (strain CBS 223.65) TaxID=695850 RepID=A0A067CS91_SAPPC|nr:hypothetical protein SPRG_05933 [Saprolegnia parasitica CBS 223.65]KDO29396.1 hypothetical protein SPRG_05933 [Saprolegnia parasitica CBS 223.65]|eukprot:XP_012199898.1 hypothetical protein SPRG_05933 [Saprolegnia parasitica CBS 223.65]
MSTMDEGRGRVVRTSRPLRHVMHLPPTMTSSGLEVSVHECPRALLRELVHVFPATLKKDSAVLGVVTCQRACVDLAQFGSEADKEKDRLLENFARWAQDVATAILASGHWADFIDPCSGLPMLAMNSSKVYSEVDGVEVLLHYSCLSAGMCKILLHPEWGAAVYPASLFTTAPYDVVHAIISKGFPHAQA